MPTSDNPSPIVLAQRIRNRIIEYLAIASSYAEQREYERSVPLVNVPSEIICQWEDWVRNLDWFSEPVFSPNEQKAIREFHAIWESVADDTPRIMPPLSDLIGMETWERLRQGAESALKVFEGRGKFSEEREAF